MEKQALLFGSDSVPTKQHQAAVDGWTRLWQETRAVPWQWTARHTKAIKEALALAGGDASLLLDRARRLLLDPPDRWSAQNASPMLLVDRWNNLGCTVRAMSRDERNQLALRRTLETMQ